MVAPSIMASNTSAKALSSRSRGCSAGPGGTARRAASASAAISSGSKNMPPASVRHMPPA